MKKIVKILVTLVVFAAVIPSLAGVSIAALWNSVIVPACGFSSIGFLHGVGLFLLGQVMTGGFVFAFFLLGGCMHKIFHHEGDWHSHWHKMTGEERKEFIERRRREYFDVRNQRHAGEDAAE